MKKTSPYVLTAFILLFAACSSPEAVEVKLDEICYEQYKDKLIVAEGNLFLPSKMNTYGARMHMGIRDKKTKVRVPTLKVLSLSDKTKNCMRTLPAKYSIDDVKVFDNEGNKIPLGSRIRVTGTLKGASQAYCELWVDKIEKVN